MVQAFLGRFPVHVAYQCAADHCQWGGIVALGVEMPEGIIRDWFSCPAHRKGAETPTLVRLLDLREVRRAK